MNEGQMNIIVSDESTKGKVALPVDREQLGSFISSLLGQQQSIEREIYGTFSIDHSWLLHIHALIEQRIRQQNHASLTAFNATIYYKDDLKRTISTIEAFEHFSETKKVESQGVKVTWTYLVNFPNKQIPEKQEITLYASAKAPVASRPEDPIRRIISSRRKAGVISYRINHTERTWGDDIETLLKNELDFVLQEQSSFGVVGSITLAIMGIVFLFSGMLFPDLMTSVVQNKQIDQIYKHYPEIIALKVSNLADVGTKLDLALKAINPSNSINKVGVGYRLLMLFAGMVMGIWCFSLSNKEKPSFVVLTRESQEYRDQYLSREKRNYVLVILSFIASITAGVVGNYLYYILSTK